MNTFFIFEDGGFLFKYTKKMLLVLFILSPIAYTSNALKCDGSIWYKKNGVLILFLYSTSWKEMEVIKM